MSDRLKELQRHRAMLQEHLAWLDREIAALGGVKPSALPPPEGASAPYTPPPSPAPFPVPAPITRSTPAGPSAAEQLASAKAAEEIIAQYHSESASTPTKVRLGCFVYFFFALGLVALVVFLFYLHTLHKQ